MTVPFKTPPEDTNSGGRTRAWPLAGQTVLVGVGVGGTGPCARGGAGCAARSATAAMPPVSIAGRERVCRAGGSGASTTEWSFAPWRIIASLSGCLAVLLPARPRHPSQMPFGTKPLVYALVPPLQALAALLRTRAATS